LKKLFILFLFSSALFKAQVKDDTYTLDEPRDYSKFPALNANYIEILGNSGFLFSLNIDRIFLYKPKLKISGSAGIAVMPNGPYIEQSYYVANNYIFFDGDHHLEIGPGLTLWRKYNAVCTDTSTYPKYNWESIWFGMMRLGYRYQKNEEGFFLKAGLTPFPYRKYDCASEWFPTHWNYLFGIAVGVTY
jgi:hypothetical protein